MKIFVGMLCAVWLVVGAYAGSQRQLYGTGLTCDTAATTAVTAAAGPLNFYGVHPDLTCPEPS